LGLQILVVIAMAITLCHPNGIHAASDDAAPAVNAPPVASPGPGLILLFASREVVRRSLEESALIEILVHVKSESIDDGHLTFAPYPSLATSFAGILQSSGIRLQI